jgi:hypothetical protein
MNKSQSFFCTAAVALGVALPAVVGASTTYTVTADTSSITGTSGYMDLQFEPGPATTNLATVAVTGFTTNGTLSGAATLTGDVTGQLPGTLNFDNQTVFNDYFQAIDFGSTETFTVTLDGPSILGGSSSAFNIAFYAADGSTALLTNSPDGEAGQIVLDGTGSTSVETFETATGGTPVLTIISPLVAPEPAELGLIGAGILLLGAVFRKRRERAESRI